jgi:hypothetical protein
MAQVCIPQETINLIKKAIPSKVFRSISGFDADKRTQSIEGILDALEENNLFSNGEDRAVFKQGINDKIVEIQKERLTKSATYKRKVDANGRAEPDTFKQKLDKISSIDDFSDELIQEGIEINLGARLTGDEIRKLTEASNNVGKFFLPNGATNDLAYSNGKYSDEFGEAFKAYKQAKDDINPTSLGKKLVSTANANLLFNLKSGITNIISNTAFSAIGSVDRTLALGAVPYKFDEAFKEAVEDAKFFAKYGFDPTRAVDIDDGIKTLGETMNAFSSEGNAFDKTIKAMNDLVYKKMLSIPDQFYAGLAKRDTIKRLANKEAQKLYPGLKGADLDAKISEITQDANSLRPQTDLGIELKQIGIAEANRVTFQEQSGLAKVSETIRSGIDEFFKEKAIQVGFKEDIADAFAIGKYIVPFVMTPANVINVGLDYSGLKTLPMLPKGIYDAVKSSKNSREATGILFDFIKTTKIDKPLIGIPIAIGVASLISPENYIGEYPTDENERRLFELGRATTNSVKVSVGGQDKWVSLDYLGPIAAPLIGILQAKKDPNANMGDMIFKFGVGASMQLTKLPALEGINNIIEGTAKAFKVAGDIEGITAAQSISKSFFDGLVDFVASRTVPSIVGDTGEALDETKRDTKAGVYSVGNVNLDPAIIKIPFVRDSLQPKQDVFGKDIKTEGISQIFFGARVKTPSDDKVVLELEKMSNQGVSKAPTDYIGKSAQTYYKIPDDKMVEEKDAYGKAVYDAYNKAISDKKWSSLNPEDKKDALTKVEMQVRDKYKKSLEKKYGKVDKK